MQENKTSDSELLSLQNISTYYHSAAGVVPGVVGVSLSFRRGEFVVITGESGSGKSTLLNVISALLPYHSGEMYYHGTPTSAYSDEDWEEYRQERISFVFQDYHVIPSYTVYDNVMSAVLLRGVGREEAGELALGYLRQVGMGDLLRRKAAKLSSGQKQRLSIARALAKDTEIIVADEPTGNLDSENGRQIVELLAELSKEKLVIMVSHNIEEVTAYATRRIRLHEGRLVADTVLRERGREAGSGRETVHPQSDAAGENAGSEREKRRAADRLAWLSITAQPAKTVLVCLFLLLCTMASTVFAAGYLAAGDDTNTKIYEPQVFRNGSDKRIVLTYLDGAPMTQEDVERLRGLRHVEQVELYDYVADVSYYCEEEGDFLRIYEYIYAPAVGLGEPRIIGKVMTVRPRNSGHFVRSAVCLTERDLGAGRLPERANEVVYGADASLIGTTLHIAFKDSNAWGGGRDVVCELEVVGVPAEADGQVYFSEILCRAFLANSGDYLSTLTVTDIVDGEEQWYTYYSLLLPDSTLSGQEVVIASVQRTEQEFMREEYGEEHEGGYGVEGEASERKVCHVIFEAREKGNTVKESERWMEGTVTGYREASEKFVFVSEEAFAELFPDIFSRQVTLYLEDYAYMDDVLRAVDKLGYAAVSPFRVGSVSYDDAKVSEHFVTLLLCAAAFLAVYLLEFFLLRAFLKFKTEDYRVLRSVGMTQSQMKRMIVLEFLADETAMAVLAAVCILAAWMSGNRFAHELLKYLRWYHYAALTLLDFGVVGLLSASYFGYLQRRLDVRAIYQSR